MHSTECPSSYGLFFLFVKLSILLSMVITVSSRHVVPVRPYDSRPISVDWTLKTGLKLDTTLQVCVICVLVRHRPVLNADVWNPDLRRRQDDLRNTVVRRWVPCQIVIVPLLSIN